MYSFSVKIGHNISMNIGGYYEVWNEIWNEIWNEMDSRYKMVAINDTCDEFSPDNLKHAFEHAKESGRDYIIIYRNYHEYELLFHYYRDGRLIELSYGGRRIRHINYSQKTKKHQRIYKN